MERLVRRSFPQARVASAPRGGPQGPRLPNGLQVDVQIDAGSLPRFLRPSAESFSRRSAYLHADPAAIEICRRQFANRKSGPTIGVAAAHAGGPLDLVTKVKKVLEGVEGATLVALPSESNSLDIDELAALLAAVDLVISDGGLVAHLAGALGTPCWIVLADNSDWRWIGAETTTLWYPQVRLFRGKRVQQSEERRTQPGKMTDDPSGAITRLTTELLNWIAQNDDKKRMTAVRAPHFIPVPLAQSLPPIFAPPLIG